jgi:hypothetical protein
MFSMRVGWRHTETAKAGLRAVNQNDRGDGGARWRTSYVNRLTAGSAWMPLAAGVSGQYGGTP